mgnify:CR=1 FL=1
MNYGKRIKELREQAGLSQTRLAQIAGVTPQAISMIESGERNIITKTADKIAAALGVTLNKLFEEE